METELCLVRNFRLKKSSLNKTEAQATSNNMKKGREVVKGGNEEVIVLEERKDEALSVSKCRLCLKCTPCVYNVFNVTLCVQCVQCYPVCTMCRKLLCVYNVYKQHLSQ